jgi:hypothetical protein
MTDIDKLQYDFHNVVIKEPQKNNNTPLNHTPNNN